jgi:hypothetical protein
MLLREIEEYLDWLDATRGRVNDSREDEPDAEEQRWWRRTISSL